MKMTENGLVLKEVKLREADKILTLLTPHHGIISASARGSLRPTGKLFSASGLYSYSEWTLHQGKSSIYSVDEATPIDVFFGLRESLEGYALAAYIAELLQIYSPTGEEAEKLLRLALNSLHLLSRKMREPELVKAVFELRSLSEAGFMPDIAICDGCGRYEGGAFYFDANGGTLLCAACAEKRELRPNLNESALAALRHIVLSDDEKIFSFTLKGDSLALLGWVAQQYLLCHLDYPPKTLAFLQSLLETDEKTDDTK